MGTNKSPDQVWDDRQILGKYPIRVRVRVRVMVRVQLPMEQPHELRIIINKKDRLLQRQSSIMIAYVLYGLKV